MTETGESSSVARVTANCKVCRHPDRIAADRALAGGASLRTVALELGVTLSSVHRHKRHTFAGLIARGEKARRELEFSGQVSHELWKLYNRSLSVADMARKRKHFDLELKAIGVAGRQLEAIGRAQGGTGEGHAPRQSVQFNIVHVDSSPQRALSGPILPGIKETIDVEKASEGATEGN
ncbi:MAG TPA: hypothetical protein VM120_07185 [Bryobacteraceae bacterium]|nr:hypothetical protein [Bryobacteraceae bacterium]